MNLNHCKINRSEIFYYLGVKLLLCVALCRFSFLWLSTRTTSISAVTGDIGVQYYSRRGMRLPSGRRPSTYAQKKGSLSGVARAERCYTSSLWPGVHNRSSVALTRIILGNFGVSIKRNSVDKRRVEELYASPQDESDKCARMIIRTLSQH